MKRFLFFLVGITFIILYIPSLTLPWSLIDDGGIILTTQKMAQGLLSGDPLSYFLPTVDRHSGRFRPAYWLFHQLMFNTFGAAAFTHHLIRLTLFLGVIFLFFEISKRLSNSRVSLVAILIFLTFPGNVESWWRLGPQEPLLTFWALFSIWFVQKGNLLSALITAFFFFTSKETTFFIIPVILYLLITGKNFSGKSKTYLRTLFVLSSVVFISSIFLIQSGYSSQATFDPSIYLSTAFSYFRHFLNFGYLPALILLIISIPTLLSKKASSQISIVLLLITIGYLVIQIAWPYSLDRYLAPISLVFALLISISLIRPSSYMFKIASFLSIVYLIFHSLIGSFTYIYYYQARENLNHQLIEVLSKFPKKHLIFNFNDDSNAVEWVVETKMHLNFFYHQDPVISYIWQLPSEYSLSDNDILLDWNYFSFTTGDELLNKVKNKQLLQLKMNYLVPLNSAKRILIKPTALLLKRPYPLAQSQQLSWRIYH